jgi:hypothetical protein
MVPSFESLARVRGLAYLARDNSWAAARSRISLVPKEGLCCQISFSI